MQPGIYNTNLKQGTTFTRVWTITEGELDLSNYQVRMAIKIQPGSRVVWSSDDAQQGSSIVIEGTNRIRLTISSLETKAFKFEEAGYDIELYDDSQTPEEVLPFLTGKIILKREYV